MVGRLFCLSACLLLSSCSIVTSQTPSAAIPSTSTTVTALNFAPLTQWQERAFVGNTRYTLQQDGHSLEAKSHASASMLYRQITVDLHKTPMLNWQWKIQQTLSNIDEQTRSGDDFPARIYIAIKPRPFSFYPRALNYVWANHSKKLSSWSSPYTKDAVVIALESGNNQAGQWVKAKRNIRNDIQQYFGEDIQFIEGIAVMTDTDNTQQSATAYYRNVFFSQE